MTRAATAASRLAALTSGYQLGFLASAAFAAAAALVALIAVPGGKDGDWPPFHRLRPGATMGSGRILSGLARGSGITHPQEGMRVVMPRSSSTIQSPSLWPGLSASVQRISGRTPDEYQDGRKQGRQTLRLPE